MRLLTAGAEGARLRNPKVLASEKTICRGKKPHKMKNQKLAGGVRPPAPPMTFFCALVTDLVLP